MDYLHHHPPQPQLPTTPPSLTLQIPLTLLIRPEILTPSHATEPLVVLLKTLQHFCPTIPIHPWALDPLPWQSPIPPTLTHRAKRELLAARASEQETAQRDAQRKWAESRTQQLNTEYWILRPAPQPNIFLSEIGLLGPWTDSAAQLTDAERKNLPPGIKQCGFLLQRFGIPLDTNTPAWHRFVTEVQALMQTLRQAFVELQGPLDGVK
ncbi:hypothetical protein N0V94_009576, partial [Neodidymelliopsis sp. IMI 364377]